QLQAVSQQVTKNGGTPETTYYVYDANGERVRKVTELAAISGVTPKRKSERLYIGGVEVYREHTGVNAGLERTSLHIMDDRHRIAMIETRNAINDGTPVRVVRFQFDNHLGSAALELDESAQIISYEEYHPYGTTSYQATTKQVQVPKRYRFTGKERDDESGFYYQGARYYAPWLARWNACDPAGLADGPCVYQYCRSNPIGLRDVTGTFSAPPGPGMIGNDPKVGGLWEQAVVKALGKEGQSYADVIHDFKFNVADKLLKNGKGSNSQADTAIGYARKAYSAARREFGKLAKESAIYLKGLQIHHTLQELAKNPFKALETANLSFQRGNAGTEGTGHNYAHEVNKAQEAGAANPGQEALGNKRAQGVEPNAPELNETMGAGATKKPKDLPAPHAPE